eukprot:Clim_evm7s65 gene=Clim_evmTU7s65
MLLCNIEALKRFGLSIFDDVAVKDCKNAILNPQGSRYIALGAFWHKLYESCSSEGSPSWLSAVHNRSRSLDGVQMSSESKTAVFSFLSYCFADSNDLRRRSSTESRGAPGSQHSASVIVDDTSPKDPHSRPPLGVGDSTEVFDVSKGSVLFFAAGSPRGIDLDDFDEGAQDEDVNVDDHPNKELQRAVNLGEAMYTSGWRFHLVHHGHDPFGLDETWGAFMTHARARVWSDHGMEYDDPESGRYKSILTQAASPASAYCAQLSVVLKSECNVHLIGHKTHLEIGRLAHGHVISWDIGHVDRDEVLCLRFDPNVIGSLSTMQISLDYYAPDGRHCTVGCMVYSQPVAGIESWSGLARRLAWAQLRKRCRFAPHGIWNQAQRLPEELLAHWEEWLKTPDMQRGRITRLAPVIYRLKWFFVNRLGKSDGSIALLMTLLQSCSSEVEQTICPDLLAWIDPMTSVQQLTTNISELTDSARHLILRAGLHGTIVWHGKRTSEESRFLAVQYARALVDSPFCVVLPVTEGSGKERLLTAQLNPSHRDDLRKRHTDCPSLKHLQLADIGKTEAQWLVPDTPSLREFLTSVGMQS